jgi:anti-sigma-K factor RsiG
MLRDSLKAEERRVSYWRRLVQGRLDLVRTGLGGREPTLDALARPGTTAVRPILASPPAGLGLLERESRTALSAVEDLWERPVPWQDSGSLAELEHRLVEIEGELSRYRRLLHERIDACTDELIADYQRQLATVTELDVRDPDDDDLPDIPA